MKKVLFSLLALTVLFSCEEDKVEKKPAIEYLTSHKWITESTTVNPEFDWYATGTKITDLLAPLGDCVKDDLLVFETNNTYYTLNGDNKCDSEEPAQTEDQTYSLSEDETQITREEFNTPSTITEISDSKLVFKSTFTSGGSEYVLTETYIAK